MRSRSSAWKPIAPKVSFFPSTPFSFSGDVAGAGDEEGAELADAGNVNSIFHIVTSSPSQDSMIDSLKRSHILLTNSLIDAVLKRFRFSHSDPSRALCFFSFASARRGFFHSPFSYDTMLYILGRARRFPDAWNLLVEMRKKDPSLISPRTLQIVLARIAKVCSVRQTVESFRKFRKLYGPLDTSCFNALLRTLCQEKSMSDARNVYHSLKREFRPDLQTFNILLSGWKSVEDAEGFFQEMKELSVEPDLVSYNCLVDVYCKNIAVDKALKVLDEMREKEISPDLFTYTGLIGGFGLIGQPDKARDILKEMREVGRYPDVAAYNAAIKNYCIAKRLGDAFALMEEMVAKGLAPNATSYHLFFRHFYWANDLESAWSLYERMRAEGCLPNTQSCMFLVRLIRRQEKVEMGMELWEDMVEKGFGSLSLVSDVLFALLLDFGRLEDAERCSLQMIEKGQKPSNLTFRRIKVLMELANKHDFLRHLEEKMTMFGRLQIVQRNPADSSMGMASTTGGV